jgi:hypothetical protein
MKDVSKSFFSLDLSDTEPSVASTPAQPRNQTHPDASPAPPTPNSSLLTLPAELRILIYEHLLIGRVQLSAPNPTPNHPTLAPAILSTCTQIRHEAISILYSANIFAFSSPDSLFDLLWQIGPLNVALLKSLHIWVPTKARSNLASWLKLLSMLSTAARGL